MMNESDFDEQKPKKRSLVWKFFEKISRTQVRCLLCGHEQNYQGTTGNILRHLKARHDLDATIKGQQDPTNQKRIIELSSMALPMEKKEFKFEHKPKISKSTTCSELSSVDGDRDNNVNQEFNENSHNMIESIPELEENYCFDNTYQFNNEFEHRKSERRTKLEDDRIIAETEYFREKASYFRIQKHLAALQAKKVKIELEQITAKNSS